MKHINFLLVLSIWLLLTMVVGCGYHSRTVGEPIGTQIRSLAIPLIESTSSSPGFEGDFTRIIREEFVSHARIPLVSRDKATTVLIAKIYKIETEPISYRLEKNSVQGHDTTYELTNRRWLRLKMDAKLVDRNTGKVIWHDTDMEDKRTFTVGTDPLTNRYNQRQALQQIARTLAKRIYSKSMERF